MASGGFALKASKAVCSYFEELLRDVATYKDAMDRIEQGLLLFPERLAEQSKVHEFLDVSLAMELHALSMRLLAVCRASASANYVPYCLAAIDYLLQEADGVDDHANLDGFEDDRQVLQAVIDHFNLTSELNKGKGP